MNSAINIMLGATILIGAAALMSGPIEERRKAKVEQKFDSVAEELDQGAPLRTSLGRSSTPATESASQTARLTAAYRLCATATMHSGDNPDLHSGVENVLFDMLEDSHTGSTAQSLRADLASHKAARSRAKSRIATLGKELDERHAARFYTQNMDTLAKGAMRCVQARMGSAQ